MTGLTAGSLAAVVAVALVAAGVQGALGFGSGSLLAPVLVALHPAPKVAVAAVLLVGVALSVTVVADGRWRGERAPRALRAVWLAAPAGAAVGALLLRDAERVTLQALLAAVLVAAALLALSGRPLVRLPEAGVGRLGTGVALGALAATTGVTGPFVAVVLAPSVPPARLRAAIGATFLAVSATALVAQAVLVGLGVLRDALGLCALLAPALVVGALAGHIASRRLDPTRRRPLSLAVATAAALLALGAAVA
jgi:uncharacterized membrane protein YfcA